MSTVGPNPALFSQLPGAAWVFPYPSPAARTAGLANISPLPIEPPPTPRTIRGDGRVHLPRAVPAARNVTRRRPAPANGPRRVRRVGTGQTPPVCGRQQEGHPAAADHTPRTDLLTNAWSRRPRRLREWAVRRARRRSGSGGGHGQGHCGGQLPLAVAAWAGQPRRLQRSSAGPGAGSARPRRALPAFGQVFTRGPRSFSGSESAGRLSSPSPVLCGLPRQGFAACPAPPRDGQPHTMRHDNTTECARMAIRRKVLRAACGGGRWPCGGPRRAGQPGGWVPRAELVSSGRGSYPGHGCRTGGRSPARARPRRGTCRRSPGQPGAGAGRSQSSACRAG
jgi:hypothetical protein